MGIFDFGKKKDAVPKRTARVVSSKSALEMVDECNDSISTEKRKQICQKNINSYSQSNSPLDQLAVAIAHKFLGASHRKQALQYYEMYIANPVRFPKATEIQWIVGSSMIRSEIAKLYESEYEYEKASERICI